LQGAGGAIIPETLNVLGIKNFDQATRIANVYLAERNRGNEADDTRGTRVFKFGTSVRVEHLRVGHLVLFTWHSLGIVQQLFRVINIQPSTDYEDVHITIQWHEDIWYTDIYGQSPQGLYSFLNNNRPIRGPLPWQPYAESPLVPAGDTYPQLSATEWLFHLAEIDTARADGSVQVQLQVGGTLPINNPQSLCQPPLMPNTLVFNTTGGTIVGSARYIATVCAIDTNGNYSAHSQFVAGKTPPTTNTNQIVIAGIGWQPGTVAWDVFVGVDHYNLTHQLSGSGTPSSITVSGLPNVATYAPPDMVANAMYVQAKLCKHGGIIGVTVATVLTNGIDIAPPAGSGPVTFSPGITTYKVMLIGRPNLNGAELSVVEFTIVGQTGVFLHLDRNPTGLLLINDVVVISTQANIASATTIGDGNFVNPYSPTGVDASDAGFLVYIYAGTGRHQQRNITTVDSSGTFYNISSPWHTIPDTTSWFVVLEQRWDVNQTTEFSQSTYSSQVAGLVDVSNYADETLWVQGLVEDVTMTKTSNEKRSLARMIYLFGQPGANAGLGNPGYYTITPVGGIATIDLKNGLRQRLILTSTPVTIPVVIWTGGTIVAGLSFNLYLDQDSSGGEAAPTFTGGAGGFSSDTGNLAVDGTPTTRTSIGFSFHGSVFVRDYSTTGLAIT
jgi:hypothetical protein